MKRILVFLTLLAAGVFALWLAIGDESMVGTAEQPAANQPATPRTSGGVPVTQGQAGASWQVRGRFHYPRVRAIALPDGSKRNETIYIVDAADSQPVGDGLQQLDKLLITIYEHGKPAAELRAQQAFVELGRDPTGKISLREDKDIDLRDLSLAGLPGSPHEGLRVQVGRAKVALTDDWIQLTTPDPAEPVTVEFAGREPGSLRGRGLTAAWPRQRRSDKQWATIEMQSDPVVEMAGIVAHASGRLRYRELPKDGIAELQLEDNVELNFSLRASGLLIGSATLGIASDNASQARVRADLLQAWLLRNNEDSARNEGHTKETGSSKTTRPSLRLLRLHGNPTEVDMPGLSLRSPQLDLLPDQLGEPALVLARNGESQIEYKDQEGTINTGRSPRSIELQRRGHVTAEALRAHGLPLWTLAQIEQQQAVLLHDTASIQSGSRKVQAEHGLRLLATGTQAASGITDGWGAVVIENPGDGNEQVDLRILGSDGFRLELQAGNERLRLGPAEPRNPDPIPSNTQEHRYDLAYGSARLTGSGTCELHRKQDQLQLELRSLAADIEGQWTEQDGQLRGINSLFAEFLGRDCLTLQITGLPVVAAFQDGEQKLTATTPVLLRTGPASWRLATPSQTTQALRFGSADLFAGYPEEYLLPTLRRESLRRESPDKAGKGSDWLATSAAQIDLFQHSGGRVLIDAKKIGDQPVLATAEQHETGRFVPSRFRMRAERVRLLPDLLAPSLRNLHYGGGSATALAQLPTTHATPWIIADQVEEFFADDPDQGSLSGDANRLILNPSYQTLLMAGDPDAPRPTTLQRQEKQRTMVATGALVRAWRDPDLRIIASGKFPDGTSPFRPRVEIAQDGTSSAFANLAADCEGNIEVLPTEVRFRGPVHIIGLDPDGSPAADRLRVDARRLRLDRQPKTGEFTRLLANDVDLVWNDIQANSKDLELDFRWQTLIARDPRCATVQTPNGKKFAAEYISVNYQTMAVEATRGVLRQLPGRPIGGDR